MEVDAEVATEEGPTDVQIYGFMADNASAGWNAVREVFWEGIPNPERERSDAFHYFKSLRRHTNEGVLEGKPEEHYALWERLQNAETYVQACRVAAEIKHWWKNGNCIPGKLKYFEGWISWWVVRWRQLGNYIRLVCIHRSIEHIVDIDRGPRYQSSNSFVPISN